MKFVVDLPFFLFVFWDLGVPLENSYLIIPLIFYLMLIPVDDFHGSCIEAFINEKCR